MIGSTGLMRRNIALVAAVIAAASVVFGETPRSKSLLPGPDNWGDLPDASYEVNTTVR
jgi:hypothetical protein